MDERLDRAPCGYMTINSQGIISYVNQTFLDMGGYSRDDLMNHHIESIMSMANKFLFHTYFYPFIQLYGHVDEMYLTLKSSKGESIPVLLNGKSYEGNEAEKIECVFVKMTRRIDYEKEIRNAKREIEEAYRIKDEALEKLEALHRDVERKQEELMRLNAKLESLAVTDTLTGLKNRRYFIEKLDSHIDHFFLSKTPFSLLIMDIDHFKKVNDTYGHLTGDQVLREFARILEANSKESDTVARYGGEEFIILLPEMNEMQSKQAAERLRKIVEEAPWSSCPVTISVGAATFTEHDTNISILAKADEALYTSKSNGRNRVTHSADLDGSS
ncbi:sensor domain-containing diguanylate cyclase [Pseudobacillus wudalianchiensis]|uniref:PAS domain S-box protein n=1 Tax=Pseudobacillus wudalianchiensis TaxID=1743143 RepID=A0A1B9B7Q6_9BACI|nr:sensor domain-containing diguanylate cyclase [Bacillus wudalianchiensis]OCA92137.1 PAS domain S-box protein [Bacillus wudalianchiensis]